MNHPIAGFDYDCGNAYHGAKPLRQAQARLTYWLDLKGRLDLNFNHAREHPCAGDHYTDAHGGITEARQTLSPLTP